MILRLLLINPPIYDFSAYDFWLKPLGLLRVAGSLRGRVACRLFDFLDRCQPDAIVADAKGRADAFGRGPFPAQPADKPAVFSQIPRRFKRFGLGRPAFQNFLDQCEAPDVVLIQTGMTYWYLGVQEVIADVRKHHPEARIVLGGVYATLCPDHAKGLGADLVVQGGELTPLWDLLGHTGDLAQPPLWEAYPKLGTGVLKLSDGCPFDCTYCAVHKLSPGFSIRPLDRVMRECELLARCGVTDVAFYDDALLYQPDKLLLPFLEGLQKADCHFRFHTPNALNARFLSGSMAAAMVEAGFKTFYLGFESGAASWQKSTGGKVKQAEFKAAVDNLIRAGADRRHITAYLIAGHVDHHGQQLEDAMGFVNALGVRIMLAEFSPIPGTPDGDRCSDWVDMSEPLWHNKTAFAMTRLGIDRVNQLKLLRQTLNANKSC